jgi:hypothetical protein
MRPASEAFAKARAALLVAAPFWGALSPRLAPIEDPLIETMQESVKNLSRLLFAGRSVSALIGADPGLPMEADPADAH